MSYDAWRCASPEDVRRSWGYREDDEVAAERATMVERAEQTLKDLNDACDDLRAEGIFPYANRDEEDDDHPGLEEFLWLRQNVDAANPIKKHGPGYCMPCNHRGPEPGKIFISANLTDEQATPICEALLKAQPVGATPEEALATICREWLAARTKGAA